jgi:flagellar hook-basal body complex protein FliE
MSQIDVNNLLSQMRQMSSRIATPSLSLAAADKATAPAIGGEGFGALLRKSIAEVGQSQLTAGRMAASFERGDPGADLASTMVSIQKAQLSLSAMNQVRNKLVDAYKDVMNMTV